MLVKRCREDQPLVWFFSYMIAQGKAGFESDAWDDLLWASQQSEQTENGPCKMLLLADIIYNRSDKMNPKYKSNFGAQISLVAMLVNQLT